MQTDYTHEILFASLSRQTNKGDIPGTVRLSAAVARSYVRKLLKYALKTPSEFDAFCLDHFPLVYQQFSTGMDAVGKMNRLLLEDLELICETLKEDYPTAVDEYENKP